MTPTHLDEHVVALRASWVKEMLDALNDLPIQDKAEFLKNKHNVAAAESYLRRSLEALFDIGRHILVKAFAYAASEYKDIAKGLWEKGVLTQEESNLMRKMAGYRNRMVHFYHEVGPEELQDICVNHLGEITLLLDNLLKWIRKSKS